MIGIIPVFARTNIKRPSNYLRAIKICLKDKYCYGSKLLGHLKKSKSKDLDFFICAARHNFICVQCTQHHLSFSSRSLPLAAQMNEVAIHPNLCPCSFSAQIIAIRLTNHIFTDIMDLMNVEIVKNREKTIIKYPDHLSKESC